MKEVSLSNLLDEMILPAVILIAARYLGIFIASFLIPLEFSFGNKFNLLSLPFINFEGSGNLASFANSISWLVVFSALLLFFGSTLLRNLYFHEHWVHPHLSFKLYNKNLEFLLVNAKEAAYQSSAWFVCTLVLFCFVTLEFLSGGVTVLVFETTTFIGLFLAVFFIAELKLAERLDSKKV